MMLKVVFAIYLEPEVGMTPMQMYYVVHSTHYPH